MTEIPESQEVINSLATAFINMYEDMDDAFDEAAEDMESPEAERFLDAVAALIESGADRLYRVCSTLGLRAVRPIQEQIDVGDHPNAQVIISFSDPRDPDLHEQCAVEYLTCLLHGDINGADDVMDYLLEDDDDDLTCMQGFVSVLVVTTANAVPGKIFYRNA